MKRVEVGVSFDNARRRTEGSTSELSRSLPVFLFLRLATGKPLALFCGLFPAFPYFPLKN